MSKKKWTTAFEWTDAHGLRCRLVIGDGGKEWNGWVEREDGEGRMYWDDDAVNHEDEESVSGWMLDLLVHLQERSPGPASREDLIAFVRDLIGDDGPLDGNQITTHRDYKLRQRALALLGDPDGERARVEGGGR